MNLNWVLKHEGLGNGLGYTTQERKLTKALRDLGVEFTREADICIHLIPPYFFKIIRFKKNVLYTMFEFDRIPNYWKRYLDKSDLVVVPCEHNREIFQAATNTPVKVCQEGVDLDIYHYCNRRVEEYPFTFLYVGDKNTRKGTYHIAKAWEMWNEKYPELARESQLIMKMTKPKEKQELRKITWNSYIDYRLLPLSAADSGRYKLPTLQSLYYYAHCFLFPTMGEGFGLTLAEAMATGLPCIYTPWSGPVDFISEEEGYPIEYEMKEFDIKDDRGVSVGIAGCADPIIESIVEKMKEIYTNYEAASKKGLKARKRIENFTWENSAKRLLEIVGGMN